MSKAPQMIRLLAEPAFELRAGAQADSLPSRVTGVAYSGQLVAERGIVIDLASTKVAQFAPILFAHDTAQVVGAISGWSNDGASLGFAGDLYTGVDETADSIAMKAQRGHKWQCSVGLNDFSIETFDSGQTAEVNGRTFSGPLLVLRRGTVRELSICALGADPNTRAELFGLESLLPGAAIAPTSTEHEGMELKAQLDETIAKLAAETTKLEAANTALAAENARADAAEAALAESRKAARLSEVRGLFAELGREFTDEKAAPYLALSAESFSAIAADLRANAPKLPAHLTRFAAGGETTEAPRDSAKGVLLAAVERAHNLKPAA